VVLPKVGACLCLFPSLPVCLGLLLPLSWLRVAGSWRFLMGRRAPCRWRTSGDSAIMVGAERQVQTL